MVINVLLFSQLVAVCSKRPVVDSLLLTFRNVIQTQWIASGSSAYRTDKELLLGSYF